jgi:hypothetical protein
MIVKRKSVLSGIERTRNIPVNPEDMLLWETGSLNIQDAMPYLNDNDREFILTGITQEEWDAAFLNADEEYA